MLLYGAARDPATCKPTKDSEIAAARAPRLRVLPSSLYSGSLAHTCSRSTSLSFLYPPMFLPVDRFENIAGQYRNVFTAISRRQDLVRSSFVSEECLFFLNPRSSTMHDRDLASFSYRENRFQRWWSILLACLSNMIDSPRDAVRRRADGGGKGLSARRVDRTPYNRLIMSRRFPSSQRPIQSICR